MTKQRRLLLVEDLGLAGQLSPALTQAGWTVQTCTSAREAIYLIKQQEVDGLLIAATLPDERGDVVFYRLSASQPQLRTHTAFFTRTSHEREVVETTQRIDLKIPVTPDQVVRTVNDFYGTSRAS
ncbi:MAG TPA: hypothetical protein VNU46_08240 [Gemmatimonadaceae bacterium]|jgi:DNA-binding response OmpR family regulator|nr:hypothetical protein [Gemmatimonadaceae bacterium]